MSSAFKVEKLKACKILSEIFILTVINVKLIIRVRPSQYNFICEGKCTLFGVDLNDSCEHFHDFMHSNILITHPCRAAYMSGEVHDQTHVTVLLLIKGTRCLDSVELVFEKVWLERRFKSSIQ